VALTDADAVTVAVGVPAMEPLAGGDAERVGVAAEVGGSVGDGDKDVGDGDGMGVREGSRSGCGGVSSTTPHGSATAEGRGEAEMGGSGDLLAGVRVAVGVPVPVMLVVGVPLGVMLGVRVAVPVVVGV